MAYYSYLSPTQKQSLIDWIGSCGEGYERFLEWCDRESIPEEKRYTRASYQSWVQRRRTSVQSARSRHRDETRRKSRMDREARMIALEDAFQRLDTLTRSGEIEDSDRLLRLEEQKRKILEAIAKERGEWGAKQQGEKDDHEQGLDDLLSRMVGNVTPIRSRAV